MDITISGELLFALIGQAIIAGVLWGMFRQELKSHADAIGDLRRKQEVHDELSALVTRLDERMQGFQTTLAQQPRAIATITAAAIKEVISYLNRAPGHAAA